MSKRKFKTGDWVLYKKDDPSFTAYRVRRPMLGAKLLIEISEGRTLIVRTKEMMLESTETKIKALRYRYKEAVKVRDSATVSMQQVINELMVLMERKPSIYPQPNEWSVSVCHDI